jgi:FtsP/CotA-like multicopper oxidase with cupredoxin domain
MNASNFKWIRLALVLVIAFFALSPMGHVQPAKAFNPADVGITCTLGPTFALEAKAGYIQMPDMNTMFMWSFAPAGGNFQHPGPNLCVNQGDTVTVTLTNSLPNYRGAPVRVSIMFPGQENVQANGAPAQPDLANASLTNSIAPGGSVTYSFIASRPGTFIYESGTDTKMQVGMGLFGVLIVRPTLGANFMYNRPDSQFTPTEEFMALLSEVDPYQHQAVETNKVFNMNNYRARYWMINGRGFPDSIADNNASWLPSQPYGALARIYPYDAAAHPYPGVERFINVGTEEFPFHPHANNGLMIGRDGYPLEDGGQDLSMEKFAFNIGPGQTWDVIFKWSDAENYTPDTNPVNVNIPDLVNLRLGMFFGGSPYLGFMQTLPPGASTLNQCGEYYIISHNHALFQLDAFGQTMSGPITYLRVDPPLADQNLPGHLLCP